MMTAPQLRLEQTQLTEELKRVNKYLNRLVDKQIVANQVSEGKLRGARKPLTTETDELNDMVEKNLLLDK